MRSKPRIALIGQGRAAKHWEHYLGLLGKPYRALSSHHDLGEARDCDFALLLVSDSAIETLAVKLRDQAPQCQAVHFSGALTTPLAWGIHPLASYGPKLFELKAYTSTALVAESGVPVHEVFPDLPNPVHFIHPDQKALYHAMAVMSGNFTTMLWQRARKRMEDLNLPQEILRPYLANIVSNLVDNPEGALTGPLARGDKETQARNLKALEGGAEHGVYESFVRLYKEATQ